MERQGRGRGHYATRTEHKKPILRSGLEKVLGKSNNCNGERQGRRYNISHRNRRAVAINRGDVVFSVDEVRGERENHILYHGIYKRDSPPGCPRH